ncbi:MAG: PAS domain S-box protein [Candidatus Hydrogenedentes bacterium]|nr:PAS domain S-box protein [Candidatus Hydrogenedentota bacterium]
MTHKTFNVTDSALRQIIDLVPHMIFARNREGRFVLVNRATAEAYGTTVEALTGQLVSAVHQDADELALFRADDEYVHRTGRPTFYPRKSFTDGSGKKRILQTHKIPFQLPGSSEPLVLGIAIDVTEEERTLQALQKSEEKYRNLVENMNDVIYTQDLDGLITYISPVVERLGMYKVEEVVGQSFAEFVHPADLPMLIQSRARTLAGEIEPHEFRVFAKDGSVHYVRTSSRLVFDNGNVAGLSGVLTDITAQKQAAEALRESEECYRSVYNMAPLAIVLWDRRGRILDWNRHAERLFGWSKEEVLEKTFCDFGVPPSGRARAQSIMRNVRKGENSSAILENLTRDGHIIICEWNNCVRRDGQGNVIGVLSLVLDITARRHAEEQRRKMEEQIQHTQKLESLGVLAGGIAHDFNNLLVGIIGNADFALSDLPEDAPVREHLNDIASTAQRAADLCRQLLAYSGKGLFVIMPLSLPELIHEMTHLLEVSIANKSTLRQQFASAVPAIEGDPTQLRQIVMNLVTNAAESFGDRSGTITVSVNTRPCNAEFFRETYLREALPEGVYVCLEVADNGCGMDAETQLKMFEPFFTTKFAGRGLGLAAVLGIVRSHHGAIKVRSHPGEGTSVELFFPASSHTSQTTTSAAPADGNWQGAGAVLVVDDEKRVLQVTAKMLKKAGFSVFTAGDGEKGVRLCREKARGLVLVILDMTMPKLSGEQAFQKIKEIAPNLPILLSSGYNEQEALARFAGKGLAGFLQKPYTQGEFLARVRAAVETSDK